MKWNGCMVFMILGWVAALPGQAIENADPLVQLAASEVRRYVYLRTGEILPEDGGPVRLAVDVDLAPQAYRLRTTSGVLHITGGSGRAVLYGAYQFAGVLGVRFYLHGDVISDERIAWELPVVDETHEPLFEHRGIQPFHDFTEGPDWWTADDYKAYFTQLAKLRMNWVGFHCYPEGGVGPEPLIWIGLPEDANADGTVRAAYPSRWASTLGGSWGYAGTRTSDFAAGAGRLFASDDYGSPVTDGYRPLPETPADAVAVFNRAGDFLRDAFRHAESLGIHTVIGTETPLTIPTALRKRLADQGMDPADPAVVRRLYEGMFTRIAAAHPLGTYWLWTPEGWTWGGADQGQVDATLRDIGLAVEAWQSSGVPFGFATSGWVLGPPNDRALFDRTLPREVAVSCINRNVGFDWVEPGFARIDGRPKWAIPWMEDDPAMIIPQLWVGRMRRDAADAHAYGCTGLMGIHWRTKVLAPNVAALADAAWAQPWNPDLGTRLRPVERKDGRLGGRSADYSSPIADTEDDGLYQTCRWNTDGYRIRVPNGAYTVTLKFCEVAYAEKGKRVFGVSVQGTRVADELDVFATAGKNRAHDIVVKEVQVEDEEIRIDFHRVIEFPFIAGIVIDGITAGANQLQGAPFTRSINCGAGAWNGYEADLPAWGSIAIPKGKTRDLPAGDFYRDWARAWFGPDVAEPAAAIFERHDGGNTTDQNRGALLPRPSTWIAGPGGITVNGTPWEQEKVRYAFVDELAALRGRVQGAGNLARFDYWLNSMRYLREVGKLGCLRGELDRQMKTNDAHAALKTRIRLARQWERVMTLALQTVDTPGEMGTVANLAQHVRRNPRDGGRHRFLEVHDKQLAAALGQALPEDIHPTTDYLGNPRLIVPTVRTTVNRGEPLRLTAIVLDRERAASVQLRWRQIGANEFRSVDLDHRGRGVYEAALPPLTHWGIEYHVRAKTEAGRTLVWPATAPGLNQTVIRGF